MDDWVSIVALLLSLLTPIALFVGRQWLSARIVGDVQHRFNEQLEALRSELRNSEEQFKSELRDRENEISTLRDSVLAGSANRQALLDKRRFDAVERVWKSVKELAQQFTWVAQMMAILKYDEVAKRSKDRGIQEFLTVIGGKTLEAGKFEDVARDEQPYIPELAWAYYSAYRAILIGSYIQYTLLRTGVDEPRKLLNDEGVRKILKATLPQFSDFIDKNPPETYYYLVEHVESLLLAELRKVLNGEEVDRDATLKAKAINDTVKEVLKEQGQAQVATAAGVQS